MQPETNRRNRISGVRARSFGSHELSVRWWSGKRRSNDDDHQHL